MASFNSPGIGKLISCPCLLIKLAITGTCLLEGQGSFHFLMSSSQERIAFFREFCSQTLFIWGSVQKVTGKKLIFCLYRKSHDVHFRLW